MKKFFKQIKLEFFYWRKCIFQYHQFWRYVYNKYILAPKILKLNKVLEKPINNEDLSIHILTCHRDLIMAIWSLASFYLNSSVIGQLYIHNDGSLTARDKMYFKIFFPSCQIIEEQDVLKNYNKLDDYKIIKKFRVNYSYNPFVKKIIDSYFISLKKFYLLFDSDVLWIKNPEIIWQELNLFQPKSFMIDGKQPSCYINFKDGTKLADELASLNAGIVFYYKNNFDLNKFTEYLTRFDVNYLRNFYFLEQGGHAFSLQNLEALPKVQYIITDNINTEVTARHYTKPRRPLFYIEGIDKIKNKIL